MAETRLSRMKQLAKGTRAAAAALPTDHQELANRVTQVADAWSDLLAELEGADSTPAGLEPVVQPAVSTLESLHFELLQVGVLEREPDEAVVTGAVDELNRLAGDVARLIGAEPGSD
jgi:hypothetical protein